MLQEKPTQPDLNSLLARYLAKQAEAEATGIANYEAEVTPYDVGPVQPLDPKLAWDEALTALGMAQLQRFSAPPHWSTLVGNHEPLVAIAFCVGNFPQMMRSFQSILTESDLAKLRPEVGRPASAPDLVEWTARQTQFPQALLALASLRLAKHFDAADAFVNAKEPNVPAEWRTAWDNEKAALAWHRGQYDTAQRLWDALEPTLPVRFNRGMSALFANDIVAAKQHLSGIIAQVPERSAWHHLAQLYLALADMRK